MQRLSNLFDKYKSQNVTEDNSIQYCIEKKKYDKDYILIRLSNENNDGRKDDC